MFPAALPAHLAPLDDRDCRSGRRVLAVTDAKTDVPRTPGRLSFESRPISVHVSPCLAKCLTIPRQMSHHSSPNVSPFLAKCLTIPRQMSHHSSLHTYILSYLTTFLATFLATCLTMSRHMSHHISRHVWSHAAADNPVDTNYTAFGAEIDHR